MTIHHEAQDTSDAVRLVTFSVRLLKDQPSVMRAMHRRQPTSGGTPFDLNRHLGGRTFFRQKKQERKEIERHG